MYKIGDIATTNNHGDLEVIEVLPKWHYRVRFLNTGYEKIAQGGHIKDGKVRDRLHPSTYGVGFIGDGKYTPTKSGKNSQMYLCWSDMIRRCYSNKCNYYKWYGEKGVTVCDEWHNFQQFAEWYEENYKEGFQIDKDLRRPGSKMYSPENCEFVPAHINNIVKNLKGSRYGLPQGVECVKGKYAAYFSNLKGRSYLGYYDTSEEAFSVYKIEKENYIKEVAEYHYNLGDISKEIYENLLNYRVEPFPAKGV